MRRVIVLSIVVGMGAGFFLFLSHSHRINIRGTGSLTDMSVAQEPVITIPNTGDIAPQEPLKRPPETIKALYITSWSAGSDSKLTSLINLINTTELNAVVVDVKDFSGYITYNTVLEKPYKYDAVELRTPQFNKLVKRLHEEGIYVIARVTVFQDPRLALARPDLALMSSSTQETWTDFKGIMWMDAAAREVWDYNLDIAEELLARGVDEVNFDYIRFASDGNLDDIVYPAWDETTLKTHVIRDFFEYMRKRLPDGKLSADLFGYVTILTNGLGIGQHLEYALPYFDAIAPMTYPSHYLKNFIGLENPAEYPYEVLKYSMDNAFRRIRAYETAERAKREAHIDELFAVRSNASTTREEIAREVPSPRIAELRPWLQDFDLGADYDADKVRAQIQAVYDSATSTVMDNYMGGWMIWNASNRYTEEAFGLTP